MDLVIVDDAEWGDTVIMRASEWPHIRDTLTREWQRDRSNPDEPLDLADPAEELDAHMRRNAHPLEWYLWYCYGDADVEAEVHAAYADARGPEKAGPTIVDPIVER